jgi:hypothetical protein
VIAGGTMEFDAAASIAVTFDNGAGGTTYGVLILVDPSHFTGDIAGFAGTAPDPTNSDAIDVVGINIHSRHFAENYDSATGVLTLTDGINTDSLTFVGFTGNASNFAFTADSAGTGTLITDPSAVDSSAQASVLSSIEGNDVTGTITFPDSNPSDSHNASVTPDGPTYVGDFSLGQVSENDGATSVGFDFSNDQIHIAPDQTLTQSYDVSLIDAQNSSGNVSQTVSVSIGGAGHDQFVFTPGVGADTITNLNPQQDTIELDHFTNAQTIQELQSLITTDAHDDAVINLDHNDSITVAGETPTQLRQFIQAGHVLLQ